MINNVINYAEKDLKADIIVDMTRLNCAKQITIGKYHVAIVKIMNCEKRNLKKLIHRKSGYFCFSLIFVPELKDFDSYMRNSKLIREINLIKKFDSSIYFPL